MQPTLQKSFSFFVATLVLFGAGTTHADTASMIALQRDAITKDNVYQATYVLSALASDSDGDGYYEAPAMASGAGPTDGGLIPSNTGAPLSDGYSNALGYCSFDNGATNTSTGRNTGTQSNAKPTIIVISAGVDGVFNTTCAQLYAGGTVSGDDYAVSKSAVQVAGGVSGTTDIGKSADTLAALNALDRTSLTDGQLRLVKENNSIYRYNATTTTWDSVSGGASTWGSSASNIYYTSGNVGIGAAFSATNLPQAKLHVTDQVRFDAGININGNAFVDASRNVTANALTFVDTTGNRVKVHSAGYGIGMNTNDMSVYVPSTGTFSVRQGGFNGTQLFTVNGTTGDAIISGGLSVTGRVIVGIPGRNTSYTGSSLELYTNDNTPPGLSFHRGGYSATLLYENDGELYVNPWTTRTQAGKLLSSGNFSSYALPLTGGTITGNLAVNGFINTGSGYQVGGVTVIDSGRNIGNVASLSVAGPTAISGAVTLSAGTANGVAYLNGSKVITTGSALTFDGTNLSNSGNYISTAATGRLTKSTITGRNVFTGGTFGGTTDGAYIIAEGYDYGGTAAGGAIQLVTAGVSSPITMLINGTESMRLNSTGLGIGTSSPAGKLHVRQDQNGVTRSIIQNRNATGTPISELTFMTGALDLSDNRYAYIQSGGGSAPYLSFGTGNGATPTERMRLDAVGNLGLGTSSPQARLDVAGDAIVRGDLTVQGNTNAAKLFLNRINTAASGISYYSPAYTAWSTYMAPAGSTGNGPTGNITAPTGSLVTSWGLRNFIGNFEGYGWTWESGTPSGQPSVVAELSSNTGNFRTIGSVTAANVTIGAATVTGVATFDTTAITFNKDLFMGSKKIADTGGYVYAANTATVGVGCTGLSGALARDSSGDILVCK